MGLTVEGEDERRPCDSGKLRGATATCRLVEVLEPRSWKPLRDCRRSSVAGAVVDRDHLDAVGLRERRDDGLRAICLPVLGDDHDGSVVGGLAHPATC